MSSLLSSLVLACGLSVYWLSGAANFYPEYALCSNQNAIYTVDEANPNVACLVVRGTYIADTGSLEQIMWRRRTDFSRGIVRWFANNLRTLTVHDIESASAIVPGLHDAHAHILEYGHKMQLQLDGASSVNDVLRRVRNYVLNNPDVHSNKSIWIEGMGWDQTKWDPPVFPNAQDLENDPVLRGHPISLVRVDGHACWVSPKVLQMMGDLPQKIEGGLIVRDIKNNPTGVFVDQAMELIPYPPRSDAQTETYYQRTMRDALSVGLTSIHDAGMSPSEIDFFKKKAEEGELPIRVYAMGLVNSDTYWGDKIPRLIEHGEHGRLTVRAIKLIMDGALGSWGAALIEPYSDEPSKKGTLIRSPDIVKAHIERFWKEGWQVNVHCIGDLANRVVLNIFEALIKNEGADVREWRPRIEHAQIMTEADLRRVAQLGVIPSVQPAHATSDMWYAESRLGPERIKGAYAYRTLLETSKDHVLPLGSDFPIEGINPLLGFYAAVTRLSKTGESPHGKQGWYRAEALTRAQALKGMTLDAAYASFAERKHGSLVPGKKADFVVLDRDIMKIEMRHVLQVKVLATVVDGAVKYGRF